ncbi:hypothetical protein [Acinetobacter radioresistens]|uniref:hypothetical protein n=1 Tax=Acinetobacter radioresistens TaxID=40216 RepID=UPI002003A6AC|nr:hypothetical protein [Acinetobacter radioresistens]MCK4082063.1 hypothetical protein [Acinetobacter radioresistens]
MSEDESYLIIDITDIDKDNLEYLGTKDKFWYFYQDDNYLFKSIQVTKNGKQHLRIGEDCSEKIACEIAKLLCIPHVNYELAYHGGLRGVISKNFISNDKGEFLVSGNELLESFNPMRKDNVHQRLGRVYTIMETLIQKKPLGFNALSNIKTAGEFFVGYLMLDALISNQDRHNENWGMIQKVNGKRHLALTFDHGASLGKNISDTEKRERLETNDQGRSVSNYCSRAKSWFYLTNDKASRLKVMSAFIEFGKYYPDAYKAWIRRLIKIEDSKFEQIIYRIPDELMSVTSKKFAFDMIKCNKNTIINNFKTYEFPCNPEVG